LHEVVGLYMVVMRGRERLGKEKRCCMLEEGGLGYVQEVVREGKGSWVFARCGCVSDWAHS